MEVDSKTKKELKRILIAMGDESDIQEMEIIEKEEVAENVKENAKTMAQSNRELKNAVNQLATLYHNAFEQMQYSLLKGLEGLKEVIAKSVEAGKNPDWSGFFKDFPTMLAQIGDNTGKTSELIRNLKWNASQQLRDVNGSPINPSIAPFAITASYDDVKLSNYDGNGNVGTVTYYQSGQVKAVLTLTYVAGNLTDVQRTT